MKDRVPLFPGRITLTPVAGQPNTYDMTRADQPVEAGTPINKATLLSDDTAALFDLGINATPDDVLRAIGSRPPTFTAYGTDLYLYITGQHPLLSANQFNDYWMYQSAANHQHVGREIQLTGDWQTITVYDNFELKRRQ